MTRATLLLQLAGPLQAWGSRSRFVERDTEAEPTRSGVTGLICAALGRDRAASLSDLDALGFGVRVDREGTLLRDFHTVQGVLKANKSPPRALEGASAAQLLRILEDRTETMITNRYYLCDAVFLGALEGDRALLAEVEAALKAPRWPLYLGRKACPPGRPVWLPGGLTPEPLEEALRSWPWLGASSRQPEPGADLRLVLETPSGGEGASRMDRPVDFSARSFGVRTVRLAWTPAPSRAAAAEEEEDACS